MPIDFHAEQNKDSYTARTADPAWARLIEDTVKVAGMQAADIGCGGGIYSQALMQLGAASVIGVDYSATMLSSAVRYCQGVPGISFRQGKADQTGLPGGSLDLVLERALIHHLDDLHGCFTEAARILNQGGLLIVQDRTPEDCLIAGGPQHLRGYFFERFPRLMGKELARRYDAGQVQSALKAAGFRLLTCTPLWETRQVYADLEALRLDLLHRTGRSLLHELSDGELEDLTQFMINRLKDCPLPIIEQDVWTVWFAVKE